MIGTNTLSLPEEILLLALRDEEGTIDFGVSYQHAIGGAILAELLLSQRIAVRKSKRSELVTLLDAKPLGDPLLDECLQRIEDAKKRATLERWITRFAGLKNLKDRLAIQLCRRGILREDEDKVLLLFKRKIYPEVNPAPERDLHERLRQAIFTDTNDIEARTVVLISLAKTTGILKVIFDKKKLKGRKKRIESLINGEITGQATKEAVEAVQAAVTVAAIMPVIVVSTVVN